MKMGLGSVATDYRRLTGGLLVAAMTAWLLVGLVLPAWAHTKSISHDCFGWSLQLTAYNTSNDNSIKIWVDDELVVNIADFGSSHSDGGSWDPTVGHTLVIDVDAWDDPTGSRGWSFVYSDSEEACQSATTTTVPETTTTTVPETTTTSVVETTTTSVQETTTTEVEETTTTVEVEGTTVTAPPETTTSSVEDTVLGTEVLPFTGVENDWTVWIAGLLAILGTLVVLAARRIEDEA